MKSSSRVVRLTTYMVVAILYMLLCTVVMLSFSDILPHQASWQTEVTILVRNQCTSGDKCRSSSDLGVSQNPLDVNRTMTVPKLLTTNRTTTAQRTVPARKPKPENWIGLQGYKTYKTNKALKRQCQSCAIVNSAGRLNGSNAGKSIDAADCVIRMNNAPIDKYQVDVGSRTTFRIIGHKNLQQMMKKVKDRRKYLEEKSTRSDLVIVWHYGWNMTKKAVDKFCKTPCVAHKHAAVYLSGKEVMDRNEKMFYKELNISKTSNAFWMSTGWGAVLFALDVCESIDVYGMIYENYCSEHPNDTNPYHYYDKVKTECSYYSRSETDMIHGHKYLTEKAVFAKWANMYGITFHEPSWDGHMEGYDRNTVIHSLFHRTFWETERQKMLELEDLANNRTRNGTQMP